MNQIFSPTVSTQQHHSQPGNLLRWWQKLSLRHKATAVVIALSTIPMLAVSLTTYFFASRYLEQRIVAAQEEHAIELTDKVTLYMRERYGDIQIMAQEALLANPKLREQTTAQDKQLALERFIEAYKIYDSIAAFDLNGNLIAQTKGKPLTNHKNRSYFQAALQTNAPVISQPLISTTKGTFNIYTAAPIKDSVTGQTIGIIRARMPVKFLLDAIATNTEQSQTENYLINREGEIFLGPKGIYAATVNSAGEQVTGSTEDEYQSIQAQSIFPAYAKLSQGSQIDTVLTDQKLLSYVPFKDYTDVFRSDLPELGWSTIVAVDRAVAFAPQRQIALVIGIGTALITVLVAILATYLAERATKPLLATSETVMRIGQGELDNRLAIKGNDEFALLGANINLMATQLEKLLQEQQLAAEQANSLKEIALKIANASTQELVFQIAVEESRQAIGVERTLYYQVENKQQSKLIAESVASGLPSAFDAKTDDSSLITLNQEQYQSGNYIAINHIDKAELISTELEQLKSLEVKASLSVPVFIQDRLQGVFIAHYCSEPHNWQQGEIDWFAQVATQMGYALERINLNQQQNQAEAKERQAKEQLQLRALQLLRQVDPLNQGDLTIRVQVTEDEIGTIADSYNSTIESLHKIVTQVKVAAEEVGTTAEENEQVSVQLSQQTIRQAEEISATLERVQIMTESIRTVSAHASQAEAIVQQANQTIAAGDTAMNQTVKEIGAIQTTVTQTADKVKKLEESSQAISQAVNLIGRFAAQTHLLALKASIEAARAGEQGKGFAVIADEVRSLATQSAEATAEIDNLVAKIQLETNEVLEAMKAGTEQVAAGTKLVGQTRQSLNQVTTAAVEINQLVDAIAQATLEQSQTSEIVRETIADVAAVAQENSLSAKQMSVSLQQLLSLANKLQAGIGKFKV